MAKVRLEIEIETGEGMPEFERAEWRSLKQGDWFLPAAKAAKTTIPWLAAADSDDHRLVLIPKAEWIDATNVHVGEHIAGVKKYRWRLSGDRTSWVETQNIVGFDPLDEEFPFCVEAGEWYRYAQVLKT